MMALIVGGAFVTKQGTGIGSREYRGNHTPDPPLNPLDESYNLLELRVWERRLLFRPKIYRECAASRL